MAIKRNTKIDPSFSMASMSDMVFLLLIFFVVTSTMINPNALKLMLPKSTNQASEKPMMTLSIKHYPEQNMYTYHIDGNPQPILFSNVEPAMQARLMNEENPVFSIHADETVPYGEVFKIINIGKRNHFTPMLAARPE